jgi:hypothetical protein
MPTEHRCRERVRLSRDLATAMRDVYLSKKAYDEASAKDHGTPDLLAALQAARASEARIHLAFNTHVKEHGCKT